jgi:hypothetical protein
MCEKAPLGVRMADIDDRRPRQFLAKNIQDQAARIVVDVIECNTALKMVDDEDCPASAPVRQI